MYERSYDKDKTVICCWFRWCSCCTVKRKKRSKSQLHKYTSYLFLRSLDSESVAVRQWKQATVSIFLELSNLTYRLCFKGSCCNKVGLFYLVDCDHPSIFFSYFILLRVKLEPGFDVIRER